MDSQNIRNNCFNTSDVHRIWETDESGELLSLSNYDAEKYGQSYQLDTILPNGLLIPIQCPSSLTLALLKRDLFLQAKKMPLSEQIGDISNYVFSTIGIDGTHVELYDEQKTVDSLHLFLPLLRLIEPEGNKTEKELNQNIGLAMGVSLREIERAMNEEMYMFRLKLFDTCRRTELIRGTEGLVHYAFPEEPILNIYRARSSSQIESDEISEVDLDYILFPENRKEMETRAVERLRRKIQFSDAYLEVWCLGSSFSDEPEVSEKDTKIGPEQRYSVKIRELLERTPDDIVHLVLKELKTQHKVETSHSACDFILQIAGRRMFITRPNVFLTQFEYIRSCFENYRIPKLILRLKKDVFADYQVPPKIFVPSYVRKERHNQYLKSDRSTIAGSPSPHVRQRRRIFWDLDENLRLSVHSASHVIVQDNFEKLFIRAAVSVGRHILDVKESSSVTPSNPRWQNSLIEFGVYLKDLPESAQISFALIATQTQRRSTSGPKTSVVRRSGGNCPSTMTPIGWMNMRVFDWQTRLLQGRQTLYLWPYTKDVLSATTGQEGSLQFLNLSGVSGPNFGALSSTEAPTTTRAPRLEVELPEYKCIMEWPDKATIQKFITIMQQRQQQQGVGSAEDQMKTVRLIPGNPDLDRLLQLRRSLDTSQLSEEDQQFLWRMRTKIRTLFPQMLTVLADCAMIWQERETICEFYRLLDDWPQLAIDTAIELLDSRYTDARLRAMAVEHLDSALDNDQLHLYLLVLIQAIRYEPHAHSPLVHLLLTRSLLDFRVGSVLFWLLRAELAHFLIDQSSSASQSSSDSSSSRLPHLYVRFALLLEAYCRGNSAHLPSMIKQVEMIGTLTTLSANIRAIGNREAANKKLQQELSARRDALQNMASPLSANDLLGNLLIDECKVMGSAKQPLLLTWRNSECLAEISTPTHQLIFKNGDDMRQDMLTLQVMRIMDAKWKSQNQDYCMTIYEVLPMGRNIGLIHVVQNCQTLFQIQCEAKGSSLNMDVSLLNKYIYKKCSNDSKQYLECVDRFTSSLAGYCVATYILGIKDRHQDNIMLAKDGRIFHIDFGHFLGHTKRKLGINRERTDFVLTDHFLYVISKGKANFRQTYEYTSFREECTKGFMISYHNARFFIILFRMMLCMGLPELCSQDDVDFLRSSLMYDKIEREDARAAFQQIFEDVVKGDWSVSINWFFHSVNHGKLLPSIH